MENYICPFCRYVKATIPATRKKMAMRAPAIMVLVRGGVDSEEGGEVKR
jgi:hypothetical protein